MNYYSRFWLFQMVFLFLGVDSSLQAECSICLGGIARPDDMMRLSCGHEFHTHCLNEWFKTKSECPNCRTYHGHGQPPNPFHYNHHHNPASMEDYPALRGRGGRGFRARGGVRFRPFRGNYRQPNYYQNNHYN